MHPSELRRALFLDRDGTIIEDRGYMRDPALVRFLPDAAEELRTLSNEDWAIVVVSNQSGVGRGLITADENRAVEKRFLEAMQDAGIAITASYSCPHAPDEMCECRKPSPYYVKLAAREHSLDLNRSWMIGDRASDILAGKKAGCRTIWLRNSVHAVAEDLPDFIAADWKNIARIIRESERGRKR